MTTSKIDDLDDQEAYLLAKALKNSYGLSEEQAYWIVVDMMKAGWKSPTQVGDAEFAAKKEANASLKEKMDLALKRISDLEDALAALRGDAFTDKSKILQVESLLLQAIGDLNQMKKRVEELEASKSNRITINQPNPVMPNGTGSGYTWTTNTNRMNSF